MARLGTTTTRAADPVARTAPLAWRRDGAEGRAALLVAVQRPVGDARRETLLRLSGWAREAGNAVCVLPGDEVGLFADLRALGFEDAGPLPRYAAPARPGRLRRLLTAALVPGRPPRPGLTAESHPLHAAEAGALRRRLSARFEVTSRERRAGPSEAEVGARVRLHGEAVAEAVGGIEDDVVRVPSWIAPPGRDGHGITAALAEALLEAAAEAGASRVVIETTHADLGRGLLLARFLPARARSRVLVRLAPEGDARRRVPGLRAPLLHDWHLETATRIA